MLVEPVTRTLNGHTLTLRCAGEEDAEMLLAYLKTTCGETPWLARGPEEVTMTVEEEKAFIRGQNESPVNLMLLAFWDGEHAGNASLMGFSMARYRHRAQVAVALYQKFTGHGIGTVLLKELITAARGLGLEQLELEVAAHNTGAIALYKKLGFELCGTLPRNMKYPDGSYEDVLYMAKPLGEESAE